MRLSAFIFILFFSLSLKAQIIANLPYTEKFESTVQPNGNWAPQQANSSWQLGTPSKTGINEAFSGINAWCTNLNGNYSNNVQHTLWSPRFNMPSGPDKVYVRFKYYMKTESCCDRVWLEYSLDDLNWVIIGNHNKGDNWHNSANEPFWSGDSEGWKIAQHELKQIPRGQNVRFRFRFHSDFNTSDDGFIFDDFQVWESFNDVELSALLSPALSSCSYSTGATIQAEIINTGASPRNNVGISMMLNGSLLATENISFLDTGVSSNYTFNFNPNLSADGIYALKLFLNLDSSNGQEWFNDTLDVLLNNLSEISSFPYVEDFEGGAANWEIGGENSTWAFGTPSKSTIRNANSGNNAWATGGLSFGEYNNNEESYILSPCFNTNSLNNAQLSLYTWWESEGDYDGANIEYSIDNGNTWQILDNTSGISWYNNSGVDGLSHTSSQSGWSGNSDFNEGSDGYVYSSIIENTLAGKASLRFKVNFGSDFNTKDDGFAFDDFRIGAVAQNDIGIESTDLSRIDVCQNDNAQIKVYLRNFGLNNQSNFNLIYEINGNLDTVNVSSTIASAQLDSITIGTLNTADTGRFELTIFTDLANDELRSNDSVKLSFNVYAQKTLPTFSDVGICDSSSAFIAAPTGINFWYSDMNLEDIVFVGDSFQSGIINSDTTFYLKHTKGILDTVGPETRDFGVGSYSSVNSRTKIEVTSLVNVLSAAIYNQGAGLFEITVEDLDGNELYQRNIDLFSSGYKRIALDFELEPGQYEIIVKDILVTRLYRNTDGADYEAYSGEFFSIIGNDIDQSFYYYLYDFVVCEIEPCAAVEQIDVKTDGSSPNADFIFDRKENRFRFYNMSNAASSYTWNFENTDDTTLSFQSNRVNPIVFLDSGNYSISLTAESDCGSDTLMRNFLINEISVIENEVEKIPSEVLIYPNPAKNLLHWNYEGSQRLERIVIRDLMGRVVLKQQINSNKMGSLSLNDLQDGYYILSLQMKNSILSKRFLISR